MKLDIIFQELQSMQGKQPTSDEKSPKPNTLLSKNQVELKREKKKKMAAFKTFLGKIQHSDISSPIPVRKLSGELVQQKLSPPVNKCKICNFVCDQGKQCPFCQDTVCAGHFRKKRRNPQTNKFARICDLCEDSFIYRKYLKNEMKLEESLNAQQSLLQMKLNELKDLMKGKKTKLAVLKQKNEELTIFRSKQNQKLKVQEEQLEKRMLKLQQKQYENLKLSNDVKDLQKKQPASLQADYQFLEQENQRITKDLVLHQKLCQDVMKAFSQREKAMYQQYYAWQQQQKHKEQQKKKQQQCVIY